MAKFTKEQQKALKARGINPRYARPALRGAFSGFEFSGNLEEDLRSGYALYMQRKSEGDPVGNDLRNMDPRERDMAIASSPAKQADPEYRAFLDHLFINEYPDAPTFIDNGKNRNLYLNVGTDYFRQGDNTGYLPGSGLGTYSTYHVNDDTDALDGFLGNPVTQLVANAATGGLYGAMSGGGIGENGGGAGFLDVLQFGQNLAEYNGPGSTNNGPPRPVQGEDGSFVTITDVLNGVYDMVDGWLNPGDGGSNGPPDVPQAPAPSAPSPGGGTGGSPGQSDGEDSSPSIPDIPDLPSNPGTPSTPDEGPDVSNPLEDLWNIFTGSEMGGAGGSSTSSSTATGGTSSATGGSADNTNSINLKDLIGNIATTTNIVFDHQAQADALRDAIDATKFNPYDVAVGGIGSATFDTQGNLAGTQLDPETSQLIQLLRSGALGAVDSPEAQEAIANAFGFANQALPGAQEGALNTTSFAPTTDQFAQNQAQFQGGFLPLAGQQAARGGDFTQRGLGLLGNSYGDVAQNQLNLMREYAQPFEERAYNSLQQRLFNQGRLGSTGGGRDVEAFARGLSQADTTRQLQAQQFAEGLRQNDQRVGLGLLNQGQGATNSAGALLGQGANVNQAGASTQFQGIGNENQRVRARLADAQAIFGFGQNTQQQQNQTATQGINNMLGLTAEQRAMIGLGGNIGGQQAYAGANQAPFLEKDSFNNVSLISSVLSDIFKV